MRWKFDLALIAGVLCLSTPTAWAQAPMNGVVTGGKSEDLPGAKWMVTDAFLYRNGTYVINTQSRSNNTTEGLNGRVFLVFVDDKGRALGVTPIYDCKTCCSTWDFSGRSGQADNFTGQIPPPIAEFTSRIDVFHFDGGGVEFWSRIAWQVKNAAQFYQDLPPPVRMAMASLMVGG